MADTSFERAIEESTGFSIKHIRETPLCQLVGQIREKAGKSKDIVSEGSGLLSHEQVEEQLDWALRAR